MTVIKMSCPYCGAWDFLPTEGTGARNNEETIMVRGESENNPMLSVELEFDNQCNNCQGWSVYDSKMEKHFALVDRDDKTSDIKRRTS